jgi:hypothetical protein
MTYACTCRKGSSSFCEDIMLYYATRIAYVVFRVVKVWEGGGSSSRDMCVLEMVS